MTARVYPNVKLTLKLIEQTHNEKKQNQSSLPNPYKNALRKLEKNQFSKRTAHLP